MKREEIAATVAANLREVLGLSDAVALDWETELSRYGMDSIASAKFSYAISRAFNIDITPKAIIDNFSVAALTRYLLEEARVESASENMTAIVRDERAASAASEIQLGRLASDEAKKQLVEKIVNALESRLAENRGAAGTGQAMPTIAAAVVPNDPPPGELRLESDSVDFGFIFFSSQGNRTFEKKYDYVTKIAEFADVNGFKALWIPERHFFEFGGIFPDPALLLSNLASSTKSIRLRSGSVVLPLHHPTNVVESWSMLDNLSQGRVDIAFASGWNPNDFVASRDTYGTLRETWLERMSQVERLWRGEAVEFYNGKQELVPIKVYPRPVQERVAIWMAISGNPETFIEAGKRGYNILTMLNSKPVQELETNIARYRAARAAQGLDPKTGIVSLMLHTYVHDDKGRVDACVNEHFFDYIKSGLKGHIQAAKTPPTTAEIERIVEHSFHYQRKHSALFGDIAHCQEVVEKLRRVGVNEIACLVDFGIDEAQMYETLPYIAKLKNTVNKLGDDAPVRSTSTEKESASIAGRVAPQEYAVVGVAGRYPGAKTLEGFWDNLIANRNCVGEISADRYDWKACWGDPKTESGKTNIKHFGLIDDIFQFDAKFFRISTREAELMDPHARLLLETAWQCIENAGYAPQALSQSRTGVFLSFYNPEYGHLVDSLEVEKASEPYFGTALSGTIKANRISFLLGLKGPSETYDTACSSALVALHRAMQAIAAGDCEQALVAGVSLLLTPSRVISLSKMGILNESGVCNPFSHPANKEVIGEGVGALLLKPLVQALAAKDYIYAVVTGSDVAHQGNCSGSLTMPSAKSLAELMDSTYRKLNLARERVFYIEGHGSGNDSDLVELLAFQQCFASTPRSEPVRVGSVKSNIGFGEGSGGMAQLSKCILALSHGVMPATINFEQADPSIDLAAAGLAIQTKNQELPRDSEHCYLSVLAYGLGGTNAHVVLRNHVFPPANGVENAVSLTQYPMVFSADSHVALTAYLRDLLSHLSRESVRRNHRELCGSAHGVLRSLAQTLIARERCGPCRVVLLVSSYDELLQTLANEAASLRNGVVQCSASASQLQSIVASTEQSAAKLAEAWIDGRDVDWSILFGSGSHQRLALPPVPFCGEELRLRPKFFGATAKGALHPLLHQNTSNGFDTRFTSEFDGTEDFFADHRVKGTRVLPGVAHIEMARAALAKTLLDEPREVAVELTSIVWLRPAVFVEAPLSMHISTALVSETEIEYDIYQTVTDTGEEHVYSQGRGKLLDAASPQTIDLAWLRSICTQQSFSHQDIYRAFNEMGHGYGASHQGIVELLQGIDSSNRSHVLAELRLPEPKLSSQERFGLHPGLLDSALQASIGLDADLSRSAHDTPYLPFALESVGIYRPMPMNAYAWVRNSSDSGLDSTIRKLDISVCDAQGKLYVELRSLAMRPYRDPLDAAGQTEAVLMTPLWEAALAESAGASSENLAGHRVLIVGSSNQASLGASLPGSIACEFFDASSESLDSAFEAASQRVLAAVRDLATHSATPTLLQVVVQTELTASTRCFVGLSGLLKTAHREYPKLFAQCIEVPEGIESTELARVIRENARDIRTQDICYRNDRRHVKRLRNVATVGGPLNTYLPWGNSSVVLITGGAGGLGLVMAKAIGQQTGNTSLILVGRSALTQEKKVELEALRALGLKIDYRQTDIADRASVRSLFEQVACAIGSITGIVHCAGVVNESKSIVEKTTTDLQCVLAPKVAGVMNLDRESRELDLEYFICFSSAASAFGHPGQAEYAAANGFMDAFVAYRTQLVNRGERRGKSLSMNWPLWAEGGMRADTVDESQMRQRGVLPLSTELGVAALGRSLQLDVEQVIVISGKQSKSMSAATTSIAKFGASTTVAGSEGVLQERIQKALVQQASLFLKVSIDDVNLDCELSEFGFDSIGLTEFCNQLNHRYELKLTPTVFFEYPTLRGFSGHLTRACGEQLSLALNVRRNVDSKPVPIASTNVSAAAAARPGRRRREFSSERTHGAGLSASNTPIAIIGMSGCFPGANDPDAFWENLRSGIDSITEVPSSRWDWQAIYGDPNKQEGKTNVKWGGFIEGVDEFDPLFFNISPREAESMDPQQRLLMTYAWKAIEDAGYSASRLSGSQTAIFVGTTSSGYSDLVAQADTGADKHNSTGVVSSIGPNRMSYFLNLHGPSEPIETACSSSLVAIHRAVRAMQSGDCEQALVGGINTMVTPWAHISFSKAGMLCEDGRCKTFSKDANGYVRGEGVGMLFLKKLSDAEGDGDHIYGLIKGSAENHGGRANSLTAPNPKAQAELIKAVYREAKIDPRSVTYIEGGATGTPLGDPIEIGALKSAFADLYADSGANNAPMERAHCGIGSVKTNIGHLELAAGVAGVIKVLMQLKHRTLAPSLHCEQINPYIQLQDSPFYLVREAQPWQSKQDRDGREAPRRAGISSFGFGGVNAHVILEEYVESDSTHAASIKITDAHPALIVLSAKTEERLQEQAKQLLVHLSTHSLIDADLLRIAYTLQVGREAMEHRLACTTTTIKELQEKLTSYLEGKAADGAITDFYIGQVMREKEMLSIFTMDEELQDAVGKWVARGNYTKLLKLWVKGLEFDWGQLHVAPKPRRISLPTYPFVKERCWIDTQHVAIRTIATSPQLQQKRMKWAATPHALPYEDIAKWVSMVLSKSLGIACEQIDPKRDIQDYGVDSVIGKQLMRELEEVFGVAITNREMLGLRTVEALSRHLEAKCHVRPSDFKGGIEGHGGDVAQGVREQNPPHAISFGIQMLEQFRQGTVSIEDIESLIEEDVLL